MIFWELYIQQRVYQLCQAILLMEVEYQFLWSRPPLGPRRRQVTVSVSVPL